MATENPFSSPTTPETSTPRLAPLLWSVAVVFGSTLIGGLIGVGIGAALGSLVPNYYRTIFRGGSDPGFDPVAVGIGQGLTQGVVFGAVIGLALVAMYYSYRVKTARNDATK